MELFSLKEAELGSYFYIEYLSIVFERSQGHCDIIIIDQSGSRQSRMVLPLTLPE